MKLTNKIKPKIISDIKLFIPNYGEFLDQFNENCIIYGRYLLQLINENDEINNTIDILTNSTNFRFLHHFLSDNRFVVINYNNAELINLDVSTIGRFNTEVIWYEKIIGDFSLRIHVIKAHNIYNYIQSTIKLKIEQNYFNGSLLVLPYKKDTLIMYEINNKIKLSDQKTCKKIMYYVKHGYTFELDTNNEKMIFKSHNFNRFKYYLTLYKYKLGFKG